MSAFADWLDKVEEQLSEDFGEVFFSDYELELIGKWLKEAFEEGCSYGKYGS